MVFCLKPVGREGREEKKEKEEKESKYMIK
jgi:hypothetical protein